MVDCLCYRRAMMWLDLVHRRTEDEGMSQTRMKWKGPDEAPKEWERPSIKPLFRLGELTTPTTFSASSPDRHTSDISELKNDETEEEN